MENRNACPDPPGSPGPVKVISGDFEPPGASKAPLVDDNPPTGTTPADVPETSPADPQS